MINYTVRRLLLAVVILWGALTLVFAVVRLVPGDPVSVILGPDATADEVADARRELGLERNVVIQYANFLGRVTQLDFGQSFRHNRDAFEMVIERLPATVTLALTAICIALVASFLLGIAAALRPRGVADRVISVLSLVGQSLPSFWVGIILLLIFARQLGWLPSAGNSTPQHLILPAVTLALPFTSILVRLIRSGLLEVLGEGYIQTARSKGLRESIVLFRHALRNMLIPVVTVAGLQLGALLGGTVVVEEVFSWPGLGRLLVDAIGNRDYTVIQASIAFVTTAFVLVNLVVDLLYAYIDPRVRVVN
ncbi:nickel ABC transporter permease [Micromonospora craniellae]|uniref:Nickel import system permease protein NikB n=1 Tax=Micromonospora craniellae TaxID=2294034 RepID=A0A372FSP0_9ACTN|nr:nickel ABC transporter permease [Micromonospora craniellae]QOC91274.1 ABC transporter permease [Micromonospora craniellae]RFS43812.1 ABC transporter permease [Micromonospora craniellae]